MHVFVNGIESDEGLAAASFLISKNNHVHILVDKTFNLSTLGDLATHENFSVHYGQSTDENQEMIVKNISQEYNLTPIILDYTSELCSLSSPEPGSWVVYSKTGCVYCDKAKNLLHKKNKSYKVIMCDELLFEDRQRCLNELGLFSKINVTTFPLVVDPEGKSVGGYTDLERRLEGSDAPRL